MPKLILLLALCLFPAAPAFADCHLRLASNRTTFSGILAGTDCETRESGTLQTANRPWIVQATTDLAISDDALNMMVTGLQKADIAARELGLDPVRVGRSVSITAADVPDPDGLPPPEAETDFLSGSCYITVLPRAYTADLTVLAPIVAHEYFHCIQAAHFGSGYGNYVDPDPVTKIAPHDWFFEGSPEWFAYFAIAGGNIGWRVDEFELRADHVALNGVAYGGFAFFTWYAQTYGVDKVMPFLRRLGERHGEPGPINDLLEPEEWRSFAQRYASYHVLRRDRSRLYPDRRQPRLAVPITEDGVETFVSNLGVFSRRELEFAPGEWRVTVGEGGPRFLSRVLSNGDPDGGWTEITSDLVVKTGCDRSERRVLLGFGTDEAETPYEIKFTRVGDPCDAACARIPVPRDACLLGRWEDTTFTPVAKASMPGTEIREMDHPPPVYTFERSGIYRNDSPFYSDVIMRDGRNWIVTRTEYDLNASLGMWGTEAGRLLVCEDRESARGRTHFATSDGLSSTGSLDQEKDLAAAGEARELSFSYSCDENRLILRSGPLGMVRGEFRRLDPLPEATDDAPAERDRVPLLPLPSRNRHAPRRTAQITP